MTKRMTKSVGGAAPVAICSAHQRPIGAMLLLTGPLRPPPSPCTRCKALPPQQPSAPSLLKPRVPRHLIHHNDGRIDAFYYLRDPSRQHAHQELAAEQLHYTQQAARSQSLREALQAELEEHAGHKAWKLEALADARSSSGSAAARSFGTQFRDTDSRPGQVRQIHGS